MFCIQFSDYGARRMGWAQHNVVQFAGECFFSWRTSSFLGEQIWAGAALVSKSCANLSERCQRIGGGGQ